MEEKGTDMWRPFILNFLNMAAGAFGFHLIERMTLLDALYRTVITMSTFRFGEAEFEFFRSGASS